MNDDLPQDDPLSSPDVDDPKDDNLSPGNDDETDALMTSLDSTNTGKENEVNQTHAQADIIEEETNEERAYRLEQERIAADPEVIAQMQLIASTKPSTELEKALSAALERKDHQVERLQNEISKLKQFLSKRKQVYKRKRKDESAPTRALSAYNLFIKERFAQLAKENQEALQSADTDAQLKRVPPSNLVAKTGNEWKELPAEVKAEYETRAKVDRKRYEEEMAQYQPPDKQANRRRNKTGYNMFFSAHVLRMKQSETGVPTERGSVARYVGNAWKALSAEEKQFYEREADKHNGMNPIKDGDEEEDDDAQRHHVDHYHPGHHYQHPEMHMHGPPPMHYDPRHHYPPHIYNQPPPPYGHYDYSQHHQRQQQSRGSNYSQPHYVPPRHYDAGL